jgi:hypothetical protein
MPARDQMDLIINFNEHPSLDAPSTGEADMSLWKKPAMQR